MRLVLMNRLSGGGLSGSSSLTMVRNWRYEERPDTVASDDVEDMGESFELSCE